VKTTAKILLALASLACGACREGRAAPPAPSASVTIAEAAGAAPIASITATPTVAPLATPAPIPVDAGVRAATDCPEGMAKIGRYCIDRWEAHLVTRNAAGEITPLPFFSRPPEDGNYEARSTEGSMPQGYISRVEAARACRNAGKRLCSMAEWQRACQGKRGTHYPYGQKLEPSRCNMEKAHLLSIKYGTNGKRWTYEAFNDPALDQEPGFLAKTGTYDQCTSDAGTYDMVGNLHEWVSDTVDEELIDKLAAEPVERKNQVWRPGNGVFMGGFFSTHEQLGPGCKYVTYAHEPSYHDYSTGFRCCADAPSPPSAKKSKKRR
jgi:hypothetical protein